nr:ABC transporter permease subunit [Amycolatopsis sp.]
MAMATLVITSEYTSGSIRASLQWVPVRNRLLLAKGAVLVPVLFALGFVLFALGTGLAAVVKGDHGPSTSIGTALSMAVATGGYFALLGLFCLGIGSALRSTAASIVTMIVLIVMLPLLSASAISAKVVDYFPGFAGVNAMTPTGEANPVFGTFSPYPHWVGLLICAAWTAAALLAGVTVLRRRDA